MSKKPKENKQLLELGQKKRAGRLISEYLRGIGTEVTERVDVVVSPDKVEKRLVSKAEALARHIWTMALEGNTEHIKLVLDRIEGKPGAIEEETKKHLSIPDRVSQINKSKLNRMAMDGKEKEA